MSDLLVLLLHWAYNFLFKCWYFTTTNSVFIQNAPSGWTKIEHICSINKTITTNTDAAIQICFSLVYLFLVMLSLFRGQKRLIYQYFKIVWWDLWFSHGCTNAVKVMQKSTKGILSILHLQCIGWFPKTALIRLNTASYVRPVWYKL